jgi:hypothetical protein
MHEPDGLNQILSRLDGLLARAVQVAVATFGATPPGNQTGGDPFRGLYVSDADAARIVHRGAEPLGAQLSTVDPLVDLTTAGDRWQTLARVFSLSQLEVDVVAIALAPDVDLRYERLFGYLHDDVTRRRPTVDLALQLLCRSFDERVTMRGVFAPDAPLVRCGVLRLVPDPAHTDPPMIGHALRVEEDVIAFLLGRDEFDRRLVHALRWEDGDPPDLDDQARRVADRLVQCLDGSASRTATLHLLLVGPNERAKLDIAHHVAGALERPLLAIDLAQLGKSETAWPVVLLLAARTALLHDALPLWTVGDAFERATTDAANNGPSRLESWLDTLAALDISGALVASAEQFPKWALATSRRFQRVEFPLAAAGTRGGLWGEHLARAGVALDPADAVLLGETFRFDVGAIENAVARSVASARWRDADRVQVERADVLEGARAEAARALPRFATRMPPAFAWDDIVLPADQLAQLHELCDRVRYRRMVLDVWGFTRRLPLGKGTAALFAGPSGSGKTMAAQVIAAALGGLDLYRVEIPAVVSKYIGETEKALEQVFREAQGTSAILFFDEADALFGKRSEVKDAHDRYANIEVAYLLQALENYDGLAILATNFRHNMDEAFVRRLAFIVNFPYPEEAERRALWARGWPPATPLGDDLDLDFLARQFKLTGGDIRNAALAAAYSAAANGGRVTMKHVIRGVGREYQKLGRMCSDAEFGPYFELVG